MEGLIPHELVSLPDVDTTSELPEHGLQHGGSRGESLPRHVAIVMDGSGRWARRRRLTRFAGHRAGVDAAKEIVRACGEREIEVLTLFAFLERELAPASGGGGGAHGAVQDRPRAGGPQSP